MVAAMIKFIGNFHRNQVKPPVEDMIKVGIGKPA
jgi:hypothetical protein